MNLDSYYRGTAIRIDIEVKDYDDNYMDPNTSINISVTDPAGSLKVDGQTPSKDDVGKYHYNVQTETDWIKGNYTVQAKAVDQSLTALVEPLLFQLK